MVIILFEDFAILSRHVCKHVETSIGQTQTQGAETNSSADQAERAINTQICESGRLHACKMRPQWFYAILR
eukprot:4043231-Amphidinium_carterae.1